MKPRALPPGSTIGVLGGGQLGRMLALEARRMGYRSAVLDPAEHGPAAQAADVHVRAGVDDPAAAARLAGLCDVVTLEWELIDLRVLRAAARKAPTLPGAGVLGRLQDRLEQRRFLTQGRFPQVGHRAVSDASELAQAAEELGYPCLLKRRRSGYDGKGQLWLRSPAALASAGPMLSSPCMLEKRVPFVKEISAIVVRAQDGRAAAYPPIENVHRGGILHSSRLPAAVPDAVARRAQGLACGIAGRLGHVGTLAVELFVLADGKLLVNEIAPRVHNSGHVTWGGCAASQFEQHLRAICGLSLGSPTVVSPTAMVNLLGDLWSRGEPPWERALRVPGVQLHLYGKSAARPGRKMGHLLALAAGPEQALARALKAFRRLQWD